MIRLHLGSRWSVRHVAMVACLLACACAGIVAGERQDGTKPGAGGTNASVRGRVAWLADAVDQQLDIKLVPESRERTLALVTSDGRILPLLEDVRGRSFRLDKRLRERDVELVVRRYQRTPALQVLRIYGFNPQGQKVELVYWCAVCNITMLELKACDCCQGPVELQERAVEGAASHGSIDAKSN